MVIYYSLVSMSAADSGRFHRAVSAEQGMLGMQCDKRRSACGELWC